MHESANALAAWESFYVIVGSSGGALIGLQFVVITLIADNPNAWDTVTHVVVSSTRQSGAPKD